MELVETSQGQTTFIQGQTTFILGYCLMHLYCRDRTFLGYCLMHLHCRDGTLAFSQNSVIAILDLFVFIDLDL